ncbi:MAG: hypothetical protein K6A90_09275 [Lachnospiraceae bacterium]|nr:hypothetical protein [Lachnospiraceae bacterium]
MAGNREETIKDLFKSVTGQEYVHGVAIGEGNYDHKTGILRAADGTEYKNDDIEAAAKYFEERCKTLHKDPSRKKESEFSAIAYEAIKIMKGRFGSNF